MNIGEVRQALRVLESETAAEQGRRKGYLNTYQDMKRKLYLYLMLTGIVGAIWGLIHIVCVQLMQIVDKSGHDDPLLMLLPALIATASGFLLRPIVTVVAAIALWNAYLLWRNSDYALAKRYCSLIHKENLNEKIFQSELLLMKYHAERERLLKIRADLAKEGIYGHSGMCYNEESRNEENRQPDGEPDSILMTMEESK